MCTALQIWQTGIHCTIKQSSLVRLRSSFINEALTRKNCMYLALVMHQSVKYASLPNSEDYE